MCAAAREIPVLYFLASPPFLSPNGNFGACGWVDRAIFFFEVTDIKCTTKSAYVHLTQK